MPAWVYITACGKGSAAVDAADNDDVIMIYTLISV